MLRTYEDYYNGYEEENLNKEMTYEFVKKSFESGAVETSGTDVSDMLPPMSRFSEDNNRSQKKENVINKLINFFDIFFNISNNRF